jgi:hypothetical protein
MQLFRSNMAVAGLMMAAMAGCGGRDVTGASGTSTPPLTGPGQAAHITVAPSSVAIGLGSSVQLHAYVEGVVNGSQSVRWSLAPPSNADVFAVSDSGLVSATCYPGGTATVVATSLADTTVAGAATVIAVPPGLSAVNLLAVNQAGTGKAATIDAVTDSIDVVTAIDPGVVPCYAVTEAELVIHRTAGDTVVARLPLDTLATAPYVIGLVFHSDATANGVPLFPNGAYSMHVAGVVSGPFAPQASSTINFTIAN